MLKHLQHEFVKPARVVILGARGFVGAAAAQWLVARNIPVLAIGRDEVDLMADDAVAKLATLLRPEDSLLVIAARAPVKNGDMLLDNIRVMNNVCKALAKVTPAHVVYVSSDAVYADSDGPLSETSSAEPSSMHGAMHLAREVMLKASTSAPLAVVRPSLLYGAADPHNGYGPNRFRRLAAAGEDIVLFGEGEERRDHVFIDDVAELIGRVLGRRSTGTLNIATGEVQSFRWIAERVAGMAPRPVTVRGSPRVGLMPHNGYRPFDPAATKAAFPDFSYTKLVDGLVRAAAADKAKSA
ncbi:MAG: NAD-dependent epimerase/dehydratase family protein [Proteobacteria bacterium]|nr:NAD-dependent epimerase/dehydratase family protein [Pseudomonadota bacterium]